MKQMAVKFYKSSAGKEPVREWLLSLDNDHRKLIGAEIKTVEFGWPLGMPVVRKLNSGLWEVRIDLGKRNIARVFFTVSGNTMVLLHGIIKKAQKTPPAALALANRRRREVESKG